MAEIYWPLWVESRKSKRLKEKNKDELGPSANIYDSGWAAMSWVPRGLGWYVRSGVRLPVWWGRRIPL